MTTLTKLYVEKRPNTDVEFWHFLPETASWLNKYEQDLIESGLLISCINEVSDDQLTFTRTAVFPDDESYILAVSQSPKPDYSLDRITYNNNNSITFSSNA
jgi:hypothetical protein